jgi:hypothetical protein
LSAELIFMGASGLKNRAETAHAQARLAWVLAFLGCFAHQQKPIPPAPLPVNLTSI